MINKINAYIVLLFKSDIQNLKKGWLYLFISQPHVYFSQLFKRTLIIGGVCFVMNLIYYWFDLDQHKVPITFHSIIGLVLGLLLMFRTTTAYDRWWEGVKNLNAISGLLNFFVLKYRSSVRTEEHNEEISKTLQLIILELKTYLGLEDEKASEKYFRKILDQCFCLLQLLDKLKKEGKLDDKDSVILETTFKDFMSKIDDCKRIKNTPIPIAYALHIKISIFLYILSLPFGLFVDMGLYSALMVMLIYYIIAGIEIISNEIENPFRGDPNDIPLDSFTQEINGLIEYNFEIKEKGSK